MKTFLALFILLVLLNGCQTMPATSTPKHGTLKVATLNLYHDKDDWPRRRVQIVEEFRRRQPDVIALQEVIQREGLANQAEWLAGQLGYAWHFVSTDPASKPMRYGNAILTRHPILLRGEQRLRPLDDSRTAGLLRIDLEGHAVNVYVTHLHWTDQGGAIRTQQVADLVRYIAATSQNIPSIVAGDFNSSADSPELGALRAGFVDAYGSQHPDADPVNSSTLNLKYFAPKRIDHVFYQRSEFNPISSQIIFSHADADGIWASDHYGVLAVLSLQSIIEP
ncbi:MAG: endonuclease/exonuclease/phosphatase family protein [Pseudoxanthomonas sp.]